MSCSNPLLAFKNPDTGVMQILSRDRWKIAQAENYFGKENIFVLPCGKCSSCLISKRKEYAVRCAMEAKEHQFSCFVTLTYDEEHCPSKLIKRDLQYFIKKLRNKGHKLRYFGCGEYGGQTARPHYHIILFGYYPDDLKPFTKSPSGVMLFTSKEVSSVWNKGFCTIQDFDPYCAGYVAGYTTKKIGKDEGFLLMSKKPGLGRSYMEKNVDKILDYDFIVDDFGSIKKVQAPRYFERIADQMHLDLTYSKAKRLEAVSLANAGEMFASGLSREALFIRHKETDDERIKKKRLL